MNAEVGPVAVPEVRNYAAAKDAAFDELRRDKVGKGRAHSAWRHSWSRKLDGARQIKEFGSRNAAFNELRRDKVGKKQSAWGRGHYGIGNNLIVDCKGRNVRFWIDKNR